MKVGLHTKLEVVRKTDIGYILTDGNDEVFLHFNDCNDRKLVDGEDVEVFIYLDKKSRKTATLNHSSITIDKSDWVEVVEIIKNGVFVDVGLRKDMFVSKDDLPIYRNLWPEVGEKLYCHLVIDKDKFILAKPTSKDMIEKVNAPSEVEGKKLKGVVIRSGKQGSNIYTEEGFLGFIHRNDRRKEPRLGEVVEAKVKQVKDNGEINMTMVAQKELAIFDDADIILNYLNAHNCKLPLCDKSSPEEIKEILGMSKAAFKRALGKLLKEKKVSQDINHNSIYLVE